MTPNLVVIGGGPAGMAAAAAAGEAGISTSLIDENEALGGQYLRQRRGSERPATEGHPSGPGASAIAALHSAGVHQLLAATAYAARPGRVELDAENAGKTLRGAIVMACGAVERVVPVAGWTLPGVVTCGAAQAMIKMHGEPVGRRVVVAGSGPFLLPVASALIGAGAKVPLVVEAQHLGRRAIAAACTSPEVLREAAGQLWAIGAARSRLRTGWGVVRIDQRAGALRVEIARLDRVGAVTRSGTRIVDCDAICLSDGFVPSVDLAELVGARLRFSPGSRTWAIDADSRTGLTSAHHVWAAGACVSPWAGARLSRAAGEMAGQAVAAELHGRSAPPPPSSMGRSISLARRLDLAFPTRPAWYERTGDEVIVCRCENVDAGTIRAAAARSGDVNAVKRQTRAGMGLCQGRTCMASVAELTASSAATPIDAVGRFSARSPARPTTLATLAGRRGSAEA